MARDHDPNSLKPFCWACGACCSIPFILLLVLLALTPAGMLRGEVHADDPARLSMDEAYDQLVVWVEGTGYDLVRANAVKVGIVLFFTIFALGVFLLNGQVNWLIGLVLAVGNMLGAWVGAKVAVDKGAEWVRRLLIAVVVVSAANLLGVFDWIGRLF